MVKLVFSRLAIFCDLTNTVSGSRKMALIVVENTKSGGVENQEQKQVLNQTGPKSMPIAPNYQINNAREIQEFATD
jgi:hypothetical protein